jgi:hypothetical protein
MSFALCYVLIDCFMCFFLFSVYLFSSFVCFAYYFVCSIFLYFSPHVYMCIDRRLPRSGNPIAVNKYIISYNTIYPRNKICFRIKFVCTLHKGSSNNNNNNNTMLIGLAEWNVLKNWRCRGHILQTQLEEPFKLPHSKRHV